MHTPLTLETKKFYRPRRWPTLQHTDLLISCEGGSQYYEASIDMPAIFKDGKIAPRLQIFIESLPILPLLVAALVTLPDKTTEDDLCAALEAVGFVDATDEDK